MKLKLFQVAILLHPDKETKDKTVMIGEMKTMLAADEKQAGILSARAIPEEHLNALDRIEVLIRPF